MRRTLAAALVAVALCAPGAVAQAPRSHLITVTASRSAFAVLTVTETVTYDLNGARAQFLGGDYAGVALGGDFATLWSARIWHGSPVVEGMSVTNGVLRPGRYKIRVFADGHDVTVTIPWTGPDVTLEADAAVDATVVTEQVRVAAPGPDALTVPVHAAPGDNVTAGLFLDTVVSPDVRLRSCLTKRADSCADPWRFATSMGGSGTAANGWATGIAINGWPKGAMGVTMRGEASGRYAGTLVLLMLRFDP